MEQRVSDIAGGVAIGAAAMLMYNHFIAAREARSCYLRATADGELDVTATIHEGWSAPEKLPPDFANDPETDFVHLVVCIVAKLV
jgi:hypothetical protein